MKFHVLRYGGDITVQCEECLYDKTLAGMANAIVGDPTGLSEAKTEADELADALVHGYRSRGMDCPHIPQWPPRWPDADL